MTTHEPLLTFHGVRGSIPVSGPETARFGGDTMCLDLSAGGRRLILDAGSGLRRLGTLMHESGEHEVDILLTHLHLDHIIGLTAFAPLFTRSFELRLHVPILTRGDPATALGRIFSHPYFPLSLDQVAAGMRIIGFRPGDTLDLPGFAVATTPLNHPGGAAGYRVEAAGRALALVTDHEHAGPEPEVAIADFCRGVDLVIYDAPWDEDVDYDRHRGWGHSTWQAGLRLRAASGEGRLACIHHAPAASDDLLEARERDLRARAPNSFFARDRQTTTLRDAPRSDWRGHTNQNGPGTGPGPGIDQATPG